MAYSLFGERSVAAASAPNFFSAILQAMRRLRANRARRIALSHLLELEDYRLDDLGINRQDVLEAIRNSHKSAGQVLASQRRKRAVQCSRQIVNDL